MTAYTLIFVVNVLACVRLQFTWDFNEEAPKHKKLQIKSHILQMLFSMIGCFGRHTIFEAASRRVQLITSIIMGIILCTAIIFHVWAWHLIRAEKNKNG